MRPTLKCPVKGCKGVLLMTSEDWLSIDSCGEPCRFTMQKDGVKEEIERLELFRAGIRVGREHWDSYYGSDEDITEAEWPEVKEGLKL